ncbi:DUF2345 domain-containing protein, partial [Gilliamella bombi]|uniref:DUF2345 domain-containing protein n=1 Tax=Gilliamella bombi TaxID=1908521 RepID=UPI00117A7284
LSTANSLTLTSENQTDINALKNVTLSSAEAMGLFAQKSGMKLFANQGDIEVQAQNANFNMAAKQDIKVDSVDGKVTITAKDNLTLICGGSYIKISSEGIELGTQDNIYLKCNVMQKMGVAVKLNDKLYLPCVTDRSLYHIKFLLKDSDTNEPLRNVNYEIMLADGSKLTGVSNEQGYTQKVISEKDGIVNLQISKPTFTDN